MSLSDKLSIASLILSLVTLLVTVVAVCIAVITLKNGDKNASASTVVALVSRFSDAWRDVILAPSPDAGEFAIHEVFNSLELACSVEAQGSLVGNSGKVARQFIFDMISVIPSNAEAKETFHNAVQNSDDFEYLNAFQDRYTTRPKS